MSLVAAEGVIRSRAWCRVDLAGGTLDIWPIGILHVGSRTVNLAISLPVQVTIASSGRAYSVEQSGDHVESPDAQGLCTRPETALAGMVCAELGLPPVNICIDSASPRGGGLGASSALTVALLSAGHEFLGRQLPAADQVARLARDIEARMMGLPTGVQDHYPALLGGVLEVSYELGGARVRHLDVDLPEFGRHLLIVYTGKSHFSAGKNWQIIRRRLEADPESVELLDGISGVAANTSSALESSNWRAVGELVAQEWALRSRLATGISTPKIETLLERAREFGSWGGKACGAGGGGCVTVICPEDKRDRIAQELQECGGEILIARPCAEPVSVERLK